MEPPTISVVEIVRGRTLMEGVEQLPSQVNALGLGQIEQFGNELRGDRHERILAAERVPITAKFAAHEIAGLDVGTRSMFRRLVPGIHDLA
jgi:hypothetical protein